MNSQLEDNGAVIGYRPKLEYKKYKNNISDTSTGEQSGTSNSGNSQNSDTLSGFENNLPSTALNDLDYAIQNIKILIDNLGKHFRQGNWSEYNDISALLSAVESDDKKYIKNFIDSHKNSITGSIIPELVGFLSDTQTRLKILCETLKELYYGKSTISTEEAKQIDAGYIEQLRKYEQSGQKGKINYISLSYDSILNRSVTMYAYNVNRKCIGLSKIPQSNTEISTDKTKALLLERLYNEVNDEINCRSNSYEAQQSIEIMQKTLYNYYDKRLGLLEMYNMFGGGESFPLMNRMYDYQSKTDKAIENIARTFMANQYYIAEITSLEQEKYDLMQNYSKLNYFL